MHGKEIARAYLAMACRVLVAWYAALLIGFPLLVLALGFKLSEGWALIVANPRLVIVLGAMPGIFLAIGLFDILVKSRFSGDR